MSATYKFPEIVSAINSCARQGHVDLESVRTLEDAKFLARFSGYFREAIRGVSDADVLKALEICRAKGVRTFRRARGLWLTDKEAGVKAAASAEFCGHTDDGLAVFKTSEHCGI